MSTYLITADIHMQEKTKDLDLMFWNDVKTLAKKHKVAEVIVIGDLLNMARPSYEYLFYLIDFFDMLGLDITTLLGNHESFSDTDPTLSPLRLIKNTILAPTVKLVEKGVLFFFLPWQPQAMLKKTAKLMAAKAMDRRYSGFKKILFCHSGLKEGEVSADYRVHQEVSIKDLCPDAYDFVLLGDYHRHQFLTDNSFYVGAPFPKSFNDTESVGVWLLDTGGPEATLEAIPLPSSYPRYVSWEIRTEQDLHLRGYVAGDVNRIACETALVPTARRLYPGARVEPTAYNPVLTRGRLEKVETGDYSTIFLEYLKSKQIKDKELKVLGCDYLKKAMTIK